MVKLFRIISLENSFFNANNVHLSKKNIRGFCVVLWRTYVIITKFKPSTLIVAYQRFGLCPGLVFAHYPILEFTIGVLRAAPKN
jgi:hypothetical protein